MSDLQYSDILKAVDEVASDCCGCNVAAGVLKAIVDLLASHSMQQATGADIMNLLTPPGEADS